MEVLCPNRYASKLSLRLRSFSTSKPQLYPGFLDLQARSVSRENGYFARTTGVPHTEHSPALQLLRSERELAERRPDSETAKQPGAMSIASTSSRHLEIPSLASQSDTGLNEVTISKALMDNFKMQAVQLANYQSQIAQLQQQNQKNEMDFKARVKAAEQGFSKILWNVFLIAGFGFLGGNALIVAYLTTNYEMRKRGGIETANVEEPVPILPTTPNIPSKPLPEATLETIQPTMSLWKRLMWANPRAG